ncbi:MAG TPA: terminase large subunit [Candidatus Binatia bacterium]|nr:terminase large subunit [Candidatus Binatia bacterium]
MLDDLLAFAKAFGIELFEWQQEAFGAACRRREHRFVHRLAGISVSRGQGKSYAASVVAIWRLLCGPAPQDIISCALDSDGAKVVLDHAKRIVRGNPTTLAKAIEIRAGELVVPSTGSRWTIVSREHLSSRGRHPDLVIYDEAGWARDDELFASLLAGQASVDDPLMLVVSTVGRRKSGPLWTIKQLHEGGDEGVFWYWSGENLSPKVTQSFLDRQRRILMPSQFAREHGNTWVDEADSFVTSEAVDAAMAKGWTEQHIAQPGVSYHASIDVGLVHDPSVICIAHRDADDECVYVDRLVTFQGSRREPVRIRTLQAALLELSQTFPLSLVRVESWQGSALVEDLQRCGLNVELVAATPKLHADEWPPLAQALSTGTLVLPPHARLRDELLGLTVEVGPTGAKVVDRGRAHQDHAVAVRLAVASLAQSAEGAGYVTAKNLATRPTRVVIRADGEETEIEGYRREQAAWSRQAFERELSPGGGPFDAEVSPYGSGRVSRWREGF